MPYINQSARLTLLDGHPPLSAGELNYAITTLIKQYLSLGVNYAAINEVIGVLECAKLELYRRIAAPYEDGKCKENGDVY